MNRKIRHIQIIILCLFIPIIVTLYYLQVYKGEYYYKKSYSNLLRIIPYPGVRGTIEDCKGKKLVDNLPNFQVALIPQEVSNKKEVINKLSEGFNIKYERLRSRYDNRYRYPFAPVTLIDKVSKLEAIKFKSQKKLKGVIIRPIPERKYIYKEIGSHILGYLGKINETKLTKLKEYGYSATDYIGKSGIEGYFDSYLRGESGGRLVEVNNKGERVKMLGFKKSSKGKNLQLTVDIELQKHIDEIFADRKGAVIVMKPDTGYIRAMVSKPHFDPNIFLNSRENVSKIKQLLGSHDSPLFNRAISATYPPGSIYKIVISTAALDSETVDKNSSFICKGKMKIGPQTFSCWYEEGHGSLDIVQAIKYSCNVFFYKLGIKTGIDKIYNYSKKFGLGEKTGISLIGENEGIVPSKEYKRNRFDEYWYKGDTANVSIGQGYVELTPLQAVIMLSLVANKSFLIRPKIVKNIENIDLSNPEKKHIDISPHVFKLIQKGLVKVVESRDGTGRLADIEEVTVAGKTGTAQISSKEPHSWFLGYAPVNDPQICLVVFIEHGGPGGIQAAKIAKKIFQYYFKS